MPNSIALKTKRKKEVGVTRSWELPEFRELIFVPLPERHHEVKIRIHWKIRDGLNQLFREVFAMVGFSESEINLAKLSTKGADRIRPKRNSDLKLRDNI